MWYNEVTKQTKTTEICYDLQATLLGISRSTLYNELKRGTVEQLDSELNVHHVYFWDAVQRIYEENRINSRPPLKILEADEFLRYSEEQIRGKKLSPDAICGEAKLTGKLKTTVCAKTLYNYIDLGLLKVKNIDLLLKVKRNNQKSKEAQNKRIFGTSIEERPEEINNRSTFGHREIDTIVGNKKSSPVILSLYERLTRKRHLEKISSHSSEAKYILKVNATVVFTLRIYENVNKNCRRQLLGDEGLL